MRWLIVFLALIGFSNAALARCDSGETVIKFAQRTSDVSAALQRTLYNLRTAINLELQGRACMAVEVDDEKYSGLALLTALQSGEFQMAAPSYSEMGGVLPDYKVFNLPFAFRDIYGLKRFQALSGKQLAMALARFDALSLAFWSGQFVQIAAKKPVHVPGDVTGLRVLRGTGSLFANVISELDTVAVTVPAEELVDAVKDGRIEAQMSGWEQLLNDKTASIHDDVTQTNMLYLGNQLIVSKTWWESLSPELKKPLSALIDRVSGQSNLDNEQRSLNARRELMASGVPVRLLTRKQRKVWLQTFADDWSSFENSNLLMQLRASDRRP
ncbi:MAG: TRAP transporter substrate-binding protein DctP [Rhizobiaceae bacterium]